MYITIKFIHPNLHSSYIIGSLCVAASFAFIFMPAIGQDPMYYTMYPGNSYWTLLYYAPFIVIFQFGWASTQISHLSLIPSLSSCEHDKVGLNSIRSVSPSKKYLPQVRFFLHQYIGLFLYWGGRCISLDFVHERLVNLLYKLKFHVLLLKYGYRV